MSKKSKPYHEFKLKSGEQATLRVIEQKDLQRLVTFYNDLVAEKREDPGTALHAGFNEELDLDEESEWLASIFGAAEKGEMVCLVTEVSGKIVANGGITRGKYMDTRHHGSLGLTVIRAYRGMGIGSKMIKELLTECRNIGIENVEVEFLSTNASAQAAYEKAGFQKSGTIPKMVSRNGKYMDVTIMSREI